MQVTWWPVKDAFLYDVLRLENGVWVSRGMVQGLEFTESIVSGQIYAYTVRAMKIDETTSPNGVPDLVGTFGFTDEALVPGATWIKLAHLTELRSAANKLRALAGLTPFAWAETTPSFIRRTHVVELRAAIAAARTAIGVSPLAFSDDPLATQGVVRAVHFQELRDAVR